MKVEERIALFIKKEKREPQAWEIRLKDDFCNINRCSTFEDSQKLQRENFERTPRNKGLVEVEK